MTHRHLVDAQVNSQTYMCRCGAEYLLDKEKWREPKLQPGVERRSRWQGDDA